MNQLLRSDEDKRAAALSRQGNDLVTGGAWNSWTNGDKDITMTREKGADPLQEDPWAHALPDSVEDPHDEGAEQKVGKG